MLATRGVVTFGPLPRPALEPDCGAELAAGVLKAPIVDVRGAGGMVLGACSAPDGAEA